MVDVILEERNKNGLFHQQDFIERTNITKELLNILVSIGAFRFTRKKKKQLLWEANFLQKKNGSHVPAAKSMFEGAPYQF